MKKKIILVMTLVVALVMCAMLASCNDLFGGGENNQDPPKATLQSVTITMAENSRYAEYFADGEITLPAGTTADFSRSDFVVTGQYSDNTTKTLSRYNIQTREGTSANSFVIDFIVDGNVMKQLNVNTSFSVLTSIVKDDLSFEYTGEEINVFSALRHADGSAITSEFVAKKFSIVEGGVPIATDAGIYTFQLRAANGYVWVEDNEEKEQIDIQWEITPKTIVLPTVVGETSFEYDGTEKTVGLNMHGFDDVLSFVDGGRDTRKGTDAGNYICSVVIRDEGKNRENYTFGGNHSATDAVEVGTFTINKKVLPVPTVAGKTATDGVYHYTYTGDAILPDLIAGTDALARTTDTATGDVVYDADNAVYPDVVSIVLGSGDATAVNAGSGNNFLDSGVGYHAINLSLTDDSNYAWAGTTESTLTIKFVIDRAQATLPADFADNFSLKYIYTSDMVDIDGIYLTIAPNDFLKLVEDGEFAAADPSDASIQGGFMMTDTVKDYLADNNINIGVGENCEFSWDGSFEDDNTVALGTYSLKLVYKKGLTNNNMIENYEPVEATVSVEVVKGGLCYNYNTPYFALENVSSVQFTPEYGALPVYSTDENGTALPFLSKERLFMNNDAITEELSITFSKVADGTYTDATEIKNAGYYKLTFDALYDHEHFVIYYYNNAEGKYIINDTFSYDWQVQKRTFDIQINNVSTIDLTWTNEIWYSDPYRTTGMFKLTTSIVSEKLYTRSHETDNWVEMDLGDYDAAGEAYYKMVVTVGYDHDNFVCTCENDVYEQEWWKTTPQP